MRANYMLPARNGKLMGVISSTNIEEYQLVLYDERHHKPKKLDQYALLIVVQLFLKRSPAYYVRNRAVARGGAGGNAPHGSLFLPPANLKI